MGKKRSVDEGAGDGRGRDGSILLPESAPGMQPGGEIVRPTPFSSIWWWWIAYPVVEVTPETRVETVAAGAGDNVHNVHNMGQGAAGGQADVHTGSNQISVAARCAISCAENDAATLLLE